MISFQYGNRSRYKIEYSSDGNSWDTYVDKLYESPSSSSSVYETKSNVRGRYVKLTMNTEGWGAGVYEIYIYSNSDNVPASANITPDSVSYDKNPVWKQAIQLTSLEN